MPRITPAERKRFHAILDESIDKMDSKKNSKKLHWKHFSIFHLRKRKIEEEAELKEALVEDFGNYAIKSECYDNMNFPLMIVDNLNRAGINQKERKKVIKKAVKGLSNVR